MQFRINPWELSIELGFDMRKIVRRGARASRRFPNKLYGIAISAVISDFANKQNDLMVPDNVRMDIYYELYKRGSLSLLAVEFRKLEVFTRMLKVTDKRQLLHRSFQMLMADDFKVSQALTESYVYHCSKTLTTSSLETSDSAIQMGFTLGGFLSEAGWFEDCETVMMCCLQLCKAINDPPHWIKTLECCTRLMHVRTAFCKFESAWGTYLEAFEYAIKLNSEGSKPNMAALFSEVSLLFFEKRQYDEAYRWSILAMKELSQTLPPRTIIDVLRHAAKACVVNRGFQQSEFLVMQAVYTAREHFGRVHPIYADALMDYGFYLLKKDNCLHTLQRICQNVLDIRKRVFGGRNLHVAIAHESMARALYAHGLETRQFESALVHVEKALQMLYEILSSDHFLLSYSVTVKGWILEETATDIDDGEKQYIQKLEAQELHLKSLNLARKAFGEINLHTANQYQNLGWLYKAMGYYEESEEMLTKTISIKEKLYGPKHWLVAVSVTDLAELYEKMDKQVAARDLYLRSIAIGIKSFGKGYSKLGFNYERIVEVYSNLQDIAKISEYNLARQQWQLLWDPAEDEPSLLIRAKKPLPIEEIVQQFFQMAPVIQLDEVDLPTC